MHFFWSGTQKGGASTNAPRGRPVDGIGEGVPACSAESFGVLLTAVAARERMARDLGSGGRVTVAPSGSSITETLVFNAGGAMAATGDSNRGMWFCREFPAAWPLAPCNHAHAAANGCYQQSNEQRAIDARTAFPVQRAVVESAGFIGPVWCWSARAARSSQSWRSKVAAVGTWLGNEGIISKADCIGLHPTWPAAETSGGFIFRCA